MVMKAFIFDFDGTLANTLPLCIHSFYRVFKEFDGKELSEEEIKDMFGPPETDIIRDNLSHPDKEEAIDLYYSVYKEKHDEYVERNSDIDDLLKLLKQNNMKLGIVTGKAAKSLHLSMELLHMSDFFDVFITGEDVEAVKPAPEGVYAALKQLGVKSEEALFAGDSDADIQAGIEAGVFTIGVQWLPYFQAETFSDSPHKNFSQVTDFIEYIKQEFHIEDTR
ncbi:phosphoglycolate phosphatase/pyrophosphatase PpaX [Salipaludibacillus aurantiacus]|uniref:Phosphoglycolate phosphatase/pyrophosphatase PpaX n=2 Tax=Salipaludibacillus aurantiacus TaxID=1601833 RepID=A0A1H9UZX4_9BACI|nr:phosphoglycolate phosphatase/pyrophosphatase PpaX [Salipaludibacillus aurantiacus]